MVTIKIIKNVPYTYITNDEIRFDTKTINELIYKRAGDFAEIDEFYVPQCAGFATLADGTEIEPLETISVTEITTTNGEALVGIYGGTTKIADGAYNVTIENTGTYTARLVQKAGSDLTVIGDFYDFENSTDVSAPAGINYSVEFFNEDLQFLGKTPFFSISNDYSDIENGNPVITEDFTGTDETTLNLVLTMSPIYDGFAKLNSFNELNNDVSKITINGVTNTLQTLIDDGTATVSGDTGEVLTLTYTTNTPYWTVGVAFIWNQVGKTKIVKTYKYSTSTIVPTEPTASWTTPVTTDTTGAGNADGSASTTVTISDFAGVGTITIDPDPNTVGAITLTDGETPVTWDELPADTYTATIFDGETEIDSFTFTIEDGEPAPIPTATISNIIPTDVTVNGGSDGTITFDVTIADFIDSPIAVLNPASGKEPISLNDGENTELSFTDLIAGIYSIEIYDGETLINSEEGIEITEPAPIPTATIGTITPTNPTTVGGVDGELAFSATIADFTGTGTAVLNPVSGTSPITLTDGANTDLSFTGLEAGTYTIQILDEETLIVESEEVTLTDPTPPEPTATIANLVGVDPTIAEGTDGSVTFDATISDFTGAGTATLTPASGTTAIDLSDGANTGLSFTTLPAGTYTVNVLDGTDSIASEEFTLTDPAA